MSWVVSGALKALMEIDETKHETLPDGRLKVTFVTSALHETPAKLKTVVWALLAPPLQLVENIEVKLLQAGPVIKRYEVTVLLRPVLARSRKTS